MKLTIKNAMAAMRAFREARGGHVVSTSLIAQRAAVCEICPMRRATTGVSHVSQVMGRLANKHRVPSEIADFSCGVCGCSLMMLLPATDQDLHKDSPEESAKRPATCWMKGIDTGKPV